MQQYCCQPKFKGERRPMEIWARFDSKLFAFDCNYFRLHGQIKNSNKERILTLRTGEWNSRDDVFIITLPPA